MKRLTSAGLIAISVALVPSLAQSTVRYANVNSATPVSPYTNWATAATTIQDAVDVATNGDLILVNDGTYQTGGRPVAGYSLTNRVAVTKPVTVQSVNGPAVTVIRGFANLGSNAVRCVYLTNDAVLSGFTLRNGATWKTGHIRYDESGAGVLCESAGAVVINCTVTNCHAYWYGGGAYFGTLSNCTLVKNTASQSGGGAYSAALNNCTISANSASFSGGGAYSGTLSNCIISSNSACGTSLGSTVGNGGGVRFATLTNCRLIGNSACVSGQGDCILIFSDGLL